LSIVQSWQNIGLMTRYWLKGRFSKTTAIGMLLGEVAFSAFVLFAGSTFLSFTSRFGSTGGAQLSEVSWSLVLSFYLIGIIQTGLSGFGLPITTADVEYVFTSPVKTYEVFAAKTLQSSTTILLTFPPIFLLYLRSSLFYKTSVEAALLAGLVTLVFFVIGLLLSADITLAFRANSTKGKIAALKYIFAGSILAISFLPLLFLIPGGVPPPYLSVFSSLVRILPSGVVAQIAVGLVSGLTVTLENYIIDFGILAIWFVSLVIIGTQLSRRQFYETLQISDSSGPSGTDSAKPVAITKLATATGMSVWSTISAKEKIVMRRAKEGRGLFFSALILSLFLVIYALAGTFTSSPTSFLLILFIIGSFGSGNAWSWMEKERLWILKTSTISLRRYVKQVFLARVTPLILYLTPAILIVGSVLIATNLGNTELLFRIVLALTGAIEIAAITMGGSMYFASKYAQSSNDDLLTSQGQDLTNLKRTIFQTIVNLLFVSPIMLLVFLTSFVGTASIVTAGILISVSAVIYTILIPNTVLNLAGDSIAKREDL
jgi:hypothetical protein